MRRWITSQNGGREYFAVPRSFHAHGALERFYVDFWVPAQLARHAQPLKRATRLFGRTHPGLPEDLVDARSLRSLVEQAVIRARGRIKRPSIDETYAGFVAYGSGFARWVADRLQRRELTSQHALFTFSCAALETLEFARTHGITTVVDQMDPGQIGYQEVVLENERWPGWALDAPMPPQLFFDRLQAEWSAADYVLVNSGYSKRCLVAQGVPANKLLEVPLVYEEPPSQTPPAARDSKGLRVLWLAHLNLRKGLPYLFEAARLLERTGTTFTVAGLPHVTDYALRQAPSNVRLIGHVPRDVGRELRARHDVFVFPTLSDGFGITQLEAMASGLPVIATPNCGDVVHDGVNGFIVPVRSGEAIAEALTTLHNDRERFEAMSAAARKRAGDFSLERYALTVESEIARLNSDH